MPPRHAHPPGRSARAHRQDVESAQNGYRLAGFVDALGYGCTTRKQARIRDLFATRAKLLQATIALLTEKSADALSLKEAARRANVSRGVAYLHFKDRDRLLNEAKSWIAERLQDAVQRFDPSASLYDGPLQTTKLVLDHPEASKLMMTAAMSGQDLDRRHPLYKLVVKMLKGAQSGRQAEARCRSGGADVHHLRFDRRHPHVRRTTQAHG